MVLRPEELPAGISARTARERILIGSDRGATVQAGDRLAAAGFEPRGRFAHSAKFRHATGEPVQIGLDPARARSRALRDLADIELRRADVPDPDEGG